MEDQQSWKTVEEKDWMADERRGQTTVEREKEKYDGVAKG